MHSFALPRPVATPSSFRVILGSVALLSAPLAPAAVFFDLDPASPSGGTDLNAFSYSGAFSTVHRINFSVDRLSTGQVGTGVYRQARPGVEEAHGDVFHTSPRGNNESIDEQSLGLIPGFFGDDIDGLDLRSPSLHSYFSIDFLSASNNFGASQFANDIFLNSLSSMFASGELNIGLAAGDDLDALNLFDGGAVGALDPGIDYAVFSLNRFSPTVLGGAAAPGDLLYTDFSGSFLLWRSAASLGLAPDDELDAVSIPEPSSATLLILAATGCALRRRRPRA